MVFKPFILVWSMWIRELRSRTGYHFPGNWSIGFDWRFESRLGKLGIATQKYKKRKSVLFWLNFAGDLSSFWKTATEDRGGWGGEGGEVGQLWYRYRLRVPRSQKHIPTQTILKYPHPHGIILPLQPVGVQGTPLAVTDWTKDGMFSL